MPKRSPSSRPPRAIWYAAGIGLVALLLVVFWWLRPRPAFDGETALALIEQQVAFGPRVPGSEAHAQTRDFIVDTLEPLAASVGVQAFTYTDAHDSSRTYTGQNVVATFNPDARRRVLLSAHWDTRPWADQDPDPTRRGEPVPGANDGASGVAVLLELARLFADDPPPVGVDMVFFDLEDLGDNTPDPDTTHNPFAIGSARFVADNPTYRPSYGILLDMVCDRNLRIPQEANSLAVAPSVIRRVWDAADRLGADAFVAERGPAVFDDHIAFLEKGIPVIDLIHAPFPSTWHTTADTPDACSAESLEQVGRVVADVVYGS